MLVGMTLASAWTTSMFGTDFMALSPYEASVSEITFDADMMDPSTMDSDQEVSVEACTCKRVCIVKFEPFEASIMCSRTTFNQSPI